ncbi:hypothetical protein AMTR_s00157p00064450 [Amborella trichopoda]|uniref:Uncharacterized protein n=1 Tax=Amborella trichopoda TaxID=13333 RepID=W1PKG1_AMBTC|nr:hypothetical protein AMTR_s00157p00064450 [Amborella trichopoda]
MCSTTTTTAPWMILFCFKTPPNTEIDRDEEDEEEALVDEDDAGERSASDDSEGDPSFWP